MPKRSFQERRKETNARYYQNRKAKEQNQPSEQAEESDGSEIWL